MFYDMALEWKPKYSRTALILLTKIPEAEGVNGAAVAFRSVKKYSIMLMGISSEVMSSSTTRFFRHGDTA